MKFILFHLELIFDYMLFFFSSQVSTVNGSLPSKTIGCEDTSNFAPHEVNLPVLLILKNLRSGKKVVSCFLQEPGYYSYSTQFERHCIVFYFKKQTLFYNYVCKSTIVGRSSVLIHIPKNHVCFYFDSNLFIYRFKRVFILYLSN